MSRVRCNSKRKAVSIVIAAAAFIIAVVYISTHPLRELYVIDENRTLEVFTAYGSFSGVAVGPHLILTVAHGANLPGEMTVNHYRVFKVWSDEEADLALLRTDERFYLYSELAPGYPLMRVSGRELGPGDSGTAIVNKAGAVCFLLKGYGHTAGRYVYKPITREAVEAVQIASG
jgi:S1-C subfamily serine protease